MALDMNCVGCRFEDIMIELLARAVVDGVSTVIEDSFDGEVFTVLLSWKCVIRIDGDNESGTILAGFPSNNSKLVAIFKFDYPYNVRLTEAKRKHEGGGMKIIGDMRPLMIDDRFVVSFSDCRIVGACADTAQITD